MKLNVSFLKGIINLNIQTHKVTHTNVSMSTNKRKQGEKYRNYTSHE